MRLTGVDEGRRTIERAGEISPLRADSVAEKPLPNEKV